MVEQGATSTWEHWELVVPNSACHAWGAAPIVCVAENLLGIDLCAKKGVKAMPASLDIGEVEANIVTPKQRSKYGFRMEKLRKIPFYNNEGKDDSNDKSRNFTKRVALYQKKRISKHKEKEKKEIFSFCERYKTFLDTCKTERECVMFAIQKAEQNGFVDLKTKQKLKPGDKIYTVNRH